MVTHPLLQCFFINFDSSFMYPKSLVVILPKGFITAIYPMNKAKNSISFPVVSCLALLVLVSPISGVILNPYQISNLGSVCQTDPN